MNVQFILICVKMADSVLIEREVTVVPVRYNILEKIVHIEVMI